MLHTRFFCLFPNAVNGEVMENGELPVDDEEKRQSSGLRETVKSSSHQTIFTALLSLALRHKRDGGKHKVSFSG